MKAKSKKKIKRMLVGFAGGMLSALCGAGGGLVFVPYLKSEGKNQNDAGRVAVACVLPISAVCAAAYIFKGYLTLSDGLLFIPFGLLGAAAGVAAINRLAPSWLRIIFGGFMIYAGVRFLIR